MTRDEVETAIDTIDTIAAKLQDLARFLDKLTDEIFAELEDGEA